MFGSPPSPPDPLRQAIKYFPRGRYTGEEVRSRLSQQLGHNIALQELLSAFHVDPNFSRYQLRQLQQLDDTMMVNFEDLPFATESSPPYITVYNQRETALIPTIRPVPASEVPAPRQAIQLASPSQFGAALRDMNDSERKAFAREVNPEFRLRLDMGMSANNWIADILRAGGYAQEAEAFLRRNNPFRNIGAPRTQESTGISSRRYLTFADAGALLQSGEITRYIVDPENQREVPSGNSRVTLIGIDGYEYDVLSRYDAASNQIFPPTYSQQ